MRCSSAWSHLSCSLGIYGVHSKGPSGLHGGTPSSRKSSLIPSSTVSLCFPRLCPDLSGCHCPGISISATQWVLQVIPQNSQRPDTHS